MNVKRIFSLEQDLVANIMQAKTGKIRIMLADDHPLLCHALRDVLAKQPDFEVIAEASDGEEAVKLATELVPDVVIMDISMPKIDGLEATRQIKASCPSIGILALTVHEDNRHVVRILQAGASAYLTKNVYGDEVINTIRALVSGETVLSPSISQHIFNDVLQHITEPVDLDAGDKITGREIEILKLAAQGMSNKDIALKLGLSQRTVKGHLVNIFLKLNVTSRTDAVIAGLRKGIFTLSDIERKAE